MIFFQINKHTRHVSYLQFTLLVFQIYILISVNEVIVYDYKILLKNILFNLGACFLVYLIDVFGAQ